MWLEYTEMRTPEMEKITKGKQFPFVPFFLKLPGEQKGVAYTREMNNVVSGDLLLDILHGKISKTEDAVAWLDARNGQTEAE